MPHLSLTTRALILLALFLLTACGITPASSLPWASSSNLPNPPLYLEVRLPEGIAAHPVTSPNTRVHVNPEQPFYYTSLWVEQSPGLLTTDVGGFTWVPAEQDFTAVFHFENGTVNSRNLTLLCLVNFEQIPCRSEESALSFAVPSGHVAQERIEIGGLPVGEHRVTAVALDYLPLPSTITDSPEHLGDLVIRSGEFMWSHSVVIYAGGYTPPAPSMAPVEVLPDNPQSIGNLYFFTTDSGFESAGTDYSHPNMIPNSNFRGAPLQVRPGERVALQIISGSSEQAVSYMAARQFDVPITRDGLPFVVSAFLDTQQIPVNSGVPSGALFGRVPQGQEIVVPLEFEAPQEPGFYSLTVLFQESPFFPRGKLLPQTDGGIIIDYIGLVTQVGVSNRVVLEVIP